MPRSHWRLRYPRKLPRPLHQRQPQLRPLPANHHFPPGLLILIPLLPLHRAVRRLLSPAVLLLRLLKLQPRRLRPLLQFPLRQPEA